MFQLLRNRRLVLVVSGLAVLAVLIAIGLPRLFGSDDPPAGPGPAQSASTLAGCAEREPATEQLHIAASQDKVGLLAQVAQGYGARRAGGVCVAVVVDSVNSGTAKDALARGWQESDGPRPDVWSPASTSWLTLLRQQLGDRAGDVLTDGPAEPIVTSPLTIAMPRDMALALNWPEASIGWSSLYALANDPTGWASKGHPEWGRFKLGKTNPNFSTSGLHATVGAYFAATGTSAELTKPTIESARTREFVSTIERSIVHYGDTSLTFLSNLLRADDRGHALDYISAVTVEENSVLDYNEGNPTGDPATRGQHGKPTMPLVAIYPTEGTLISDHPYAVLSWTSGAKATVAADFLTHLHAGDTQRMFQDHGYRDYQGHPGPRATAANGVLGEHELTLLTPPSADILLAVQESWTATRKRANLLLVVDVSASMKQPVPGVGRTRLQLAQDAATKALPRLTDDDRVGLWMFSTELDGDVDYRQLVPIGPLGEQTVAGRRREALNSNIANLQLVAGTGLYDSTLAAFRAVAATADPTVINAVMVLTDGKNEDSRSVDLPGLLDQLRAGSTTAPVRVFTLAYGEQAEQGILRQVAEATDGAMYQAADPRTIEQVLAAVISNF